MLDLEGPPEGEGEIDGVVGDALIAAGSAAAADVSASTAGFITHPWITVIGPR